jgi:long-subunit acyl-CoA synthetase (AMP-forming)
MQSAMGTVEEARAHIEASIAGKTILTEFRQAVEQSGERPALHWRSADGWQSLSWSQYRDEVRRAAYGLKSLGLARGGFGTILTRNRPEHLIADLALLLAHHPSIATAVQAAVDSTNQTVSRAEHIRKFTVLPVDWTAESGELTPTLKLKRRVINERTRPRSRRSIPKPDPHSTDDVA